MKKITTPALLVVVSGMVFGQISPRPSSSPSGAAGGNLSGTYPNPVVAKINGTTVAVNSTANQVALTTAAAVTAWTGIPSCQDTVGQHLNFNTTTHAFSCGASLPTTAVTPGSYTNTSLTVDAQGRLTAASNGAGGTPGSPVNSVQFNSAGSFAGDANFSYQNGVLNLGQVNSVQWLGQLMLKVMTDDVVTGGEILVGEQDSGDGTGYQLAYHAAYYGGAGSFNHLKDTYIDLENFGGGVVQQMLGPYVFGANDAGSHTNDFLGHYSLFWNQNGSQLDRYRGFYNAGVNNFSASGHVDDAVGFWSDDMAGNADNPYYSWFDSRGVRRVKEDSAFDSVGQAIEALYNPQFTKYTAGAVNFERVVLGQWNGNVAEIGNQAGGTGVLRPLRLIGTSVEVSALKTATNCSSAASPAVCASAAAGSVAIPTGTNPTLVVNTDKVTANSQILLQSDDSLGTKLSITCNSTLASIAAGIVVTARTAGTSFTITFNGVLATNPLCLSYAIIN